MTELILMPSHADRWLHCPESAKEKVFTFYGSLSYGQAIHELGALKSEMVLERDPKKRQKKYQRIIDFKNDYRNVINIRGEILTDKYANYILSQVSQDHIEYGIEQEIDLSFIYPGMQGRPDFYIVHKGLLKIVDLKTSYKEIKVKKNKQLMLYAVGIMRRFQDIKHINLCIFQEKKVHGWDITPEELEDWYQNQVSSAIDRISIGGANGGEWCQGCPKLLRCNTAPKRYKLRAHN